MKRKKGSFYNIIIACMVSVAMAGCADEESFSSSRSHLLAFSADTVSLDTTFSNVPTPTRSFWVYNRSGKSLRRAFDFDPRCIWERLVTRHFRLFT